MVDEKDKGQEEMVVVGGPERDKKEMTIVVDE